METSKRKSRTAGVRTERGSWTETTRGELTDQYESLLGEIKERIRSAQLVALRQVNREMITLYSDIGRLIVAR